MNPNTLALIGIVLTVVGWIGLIIWRVYRGGTMVGAHESQVTALRQDIQELHEIISLNNELHNENYKDFYREFTTLRLKIAKELGINGSN